MYVDFVPGEKFHVKAQEKLLSSIRNTKTKKKKDVNPSLYENA